MTVQSLQTTLQNSSAVSQFMLATGIAGSNQIFGIAQARNINDVPADAYVIPRFKDGSVPQSLAHGLSDGDLNLVKRRFRMALKKKRRDTLWGDTHVTKLGPEGSHILNVVSAGVESGDHDIDYMVFGTTLLALLKARDMGFSRVVLPYPDTDIEEPLWPVLGAIEAFWYDLPEDDPQEIVIVAKDESSFESAKNVFQASPRFEQKSILTDAFPDYVFGDGCDQRTNQPNLMQSISKIVKKNRRYYDRGNPKIVIGPSCDPFNPFKLEGRRITKQSELSGLVEDRFQQANIPIFDNMGFDHGTAFYSIHLDTMYLDPNIVSYFIADTFLSIIFREERLDDRVIASIQHEWAHYDMGLVLSSMDVRRVFRNGLEALSRDPRSYEEIEEVLDQSITEIFSGIFMLGLHIADEALAYNYESDESLFAEYMLESVDRGMYDVRAIDLARMMYHKIADMIMKRGKKRTLKAVREAASLAYLNKIDIFSLFGISM